MSIPTLLVRGVRLVFVAALFGGALTAQAPHRPPGLTVVPEIDGDLTRAALTLLFFGALLLVRPEPRTAEGPSA